MQNSWHTRPTCVACGYTDWVGIQPPLGSRCRMHLCNLITLPKFRLVDAHSRRRTPPRRLHLVGQTFEPRQRIQTALSRTIQNQFQAASRAQSLPMRLTRCVHRASSTAPLRVQHQHRPQPRAETRQRLTHRPRIARCGR